MRMDAPPDLAASDCNTSAETVAELVGQVYETAPAAERSRTDRIWAPLDGRLVEPLGLLCE